MKMHLILLSEILAILPRPQCVNWKSAQIWVLVVIWEVISLSLDQCWIKHMTSLVHIGLTWPWWLHQMETFSTLLDIFAGNSPVNSPHKGQWRGAFDVFYDLCLNKQLSKQLWGWWFETLSPPLWCHCNVTCLDVLLSRPVIQFWPWPDFLNVHDLPDPRIHIFLCFQGNLI